MNADEKFPSSDYRRVDDVHIFMEHVGRNGKGHPERFDKTSLQKIVDRCNARDEKGSFCPITLGHTPTPDMKEKGVKQPPIIGYLSNYKLAKLKDDVWSITASEYRREDKLDDFRDNPPRS